MIIRVRFTKTGYLKFLSHLDLVRLFTRSFSRSGIPVKFTEGFNPHPKFSIGNPLSLGIESTAEYMEIEFAEDIRPEKVMVSLNTVLPEGIKVTEAVVSEGTASLTSLIRWSHYEIRLWVKNEADRTTLADKLKGWDDLDSVLIDKKKKRGKNKISVRVDIKPLIGNLQFKDFDQDGFAVLCALLKTGEEGNLKPSDLAEALETHLSLGIDLEMTQIKRLDAFVEKDGKIEKPI